MRAQAVHSSSVGPPTLRLFFDIRGLGGGQVLLLGARGAIYGKARQAKEGLRLPEEVLYPMEDRITCAALSRARKKTVDKGGGSNRMANTKGR